MTGENGTASPHRMFQLPLLTPQITWSTSRIEDLPDLRKLSTKTLIGLDTETKDPNLKKLGPGGARGDGHIVGVSISTEEFGNRYIPIRHGDGTTADGNVEDPDKAIEWLKYNLGGDQPKVGANILYDMEMLSVDGIALGGRKHCVQVAEALLDEWRFKYNLDSLSQTYLGSQKFESDLGAAATAYGVDPKAELWRLPAGYVGKYAERDALLPRLIFPMQAKLLEEQDLGEAYQLERELLDVLLAMRLKGVRIDLAKAEIAGEKLLKEEADLQVQLNMLTGSEIDVWSGKSLAKMFTKASIQFPYTDRGNPSFPAIWLEANRSKESQLVSRIRKINKARGTFIDGMFLEHASHVDEQKRTAYIHASFKSLKDDDGGAKHGRFACQKPNLQQVSARDKELAPLIRGCIIAEEGEIFGKADYSAQEPRMQDHYAIGLKVKGWEMVKAAYDNDPKLDRHQWVANLMGRPDERGICKVLNLSIAYGAGASSVSEQLGVSKRVAKNEIDHYYISCPFVKSLQEKMSERAESRGYLVLMGGRRCRFPFWEPEKKNWDEYATPKVLEEAEKEWPGQKLKRAFAHKALNRQIQGSSSHQTKKAMVLAYGAGIIPQLPVHDELSGSRKDEKELKLLSDIMIEAVPLKVPTFVDVKVGQNWGDCL
tara:strand:- start:8265 stop:10229 length:1965 start_codon:yes stop_codon:yes gene_type:complete